MSSQATELAIEVKNLRKEYRTPFTGRRIVAVDDTSFQVERGQVFGFLGPNGAGKTTTIRTLMGLIKPTSGELRIFGHRVPARETRLKLGFLPEGPYFYDYLTVYEFLLLVGRLHGVVGAERAKRASTLIELVGLAHARNLRMRKYSKGMLQRAGIAQALMGNPELVVFDEPMSGLDAVGRAHVRQIIRDLADNGKTVFFSSHILTDVEMICDHVAFIVAGKIRASGALESFRVVDDKRQITLRRMDTSDDEAAKALVEEYGASFEDGVAQCEVVSAQETDFLIDKARAAGLRIEAVSPKLRSLEDTYLEYAGGSSDIDKRHSGHRSAEHQARAEVDDAVATEDES